MDFTFSSLITQLENRELILPGKIAQSEMMSNYKTYEAPVPENARNASVLCLFFPSEEGFTHFILIKRVSNVPDDPHAGQISFPGGSQEKGEKPVDAAIRETHEEVGVIKDDINITRQLTELYIPVSNFLVHPFIGYIDYEPVINPQLSEVHSVLFVTLSELLDNSTLKVGNIRARGKTFSGVKYFDFQGETVWGATAMMLNEVKQLLKS